MAIILGKHHSSFMRRIWSSVDTAGVIRVCRPMETIRDNRWRDTLWEGSKMGYCRHCTGDYRRINRQYIVTSTNAWKRESETLTMVRNYPMATGMYSPL